MRVFGTILTRQILFCSSRDGPTCKPTQPDSDDAYGYVPEPGETLIRSDDVAVILAYRRGRPIKIVYPDGRVEPFAHPGREGNA